MLIIDDLEDVDEETDFLIAGTAKFFLARGESSLIEVDEFEETDLGFLTGIIDSFSMESAFIIGILLPGTRKFQKLIC